MDECSIGCPELQETFEEIYFMVLGDMITDLIIRTDISHRYVFDLQH